LTWTPRLHGKHCMKHLGGCIVLACRTNFMSARHLILYDNSYKSSAVAEMGDRGHNRHGPKRGAAVPLSQGGLGPRLTQRGLVCFRTKWRLHPASRLATTHLGQKLGAVPLLRGGSGAATSSNTTSPGPRFTSVPSGILIHPAIWPQ